MNDVVITGIGIVTSLGTGAEQVWENLLKGRSGAARITSFDTADLPVKIACEVADFDAAALIGQREAARLDRFAQMGVVASDLAVAHAGWEPPADPSRAGVIIGSGIGGLGTIEHEHMRLLQGGPRRVSPFTIPRLMPNAAAGATAMRHGLVGPNYAPASACATGAHALGEAYRWLRTGAVDMILAGGTEAALTPLALAAFARMGALSTRNDEPSGASRPFDGERDGFVAAEGAAVLVLETAAAARRRGARPMARIAGYGASADAYHVTQPDPTGAGAALAMRNALADARLRADDVDYVNAHGTGTPYNDRIETLALKEALGVEAKRIPVSSSKSQLGHLLGAAGAVEAALCALAIDRSIVPGTINLETPDPECDLDYVSDGPREAKVAVALSNSFGFGGQNACLALTAP